MTKINNFTNDDKAAGVAQASIDYGDGIGDINPQDVESMNVLKGDAAVKKYGEKAKDGVLMLFSQTGPSRKGRQKLFAVCSS